jgi:trimeric autotransporter adhesin
LLFFIFFHISANFYLTYKLSIMKKLLLLCFALIVVQMTFGQLTGPKSIPGDYATIEAAIVALNAQGVGSGGVTFNIAAGHTETFTVVTAGKITTTTGSSTNPIIFQKSGSGANPLVTAPLNGIGTTDYIFCITGTDYLTFDGIDVQENSGNTTTTTQAEWGYAILKASATDGSQNVTIKNCNISLNKTNTATYGIYSNNVTPTAPTTQLTVTAATGQNANNKFYGNAISNSYNGIYIYGFADGVSPYNYYDQGNDIGSITGNTFTDFAGGTTTSYQVYMAYQNGFKIANCNINGGTGTTGSVYGIYGSTATNANGSIYGNTIQISTAGTTGYIYGIYNSGLGTSGTTNTLNIYNNTIQNCTQPTSTTSYFYGLYNLATAFTINLYGNTVTNNVFGGSYYMYLCYTTSVSGGTANVYNNTVSNNSRSGAGTQSGSSYLYCLYVVGSGSTSIHDNNIFGNSIGPVGPSYGGNIYGLYCSNSSPNQNIYNNSIHDQTITSTYTSSHLIYGIYSFPSSTSVGSIYNNSLYNFTIALNSTGYGYIYGIYSYYQSSIYGNSLYNINVTNASTGYGYGYGYYLNGSTNSNNIYKNKLYGVSMAGASGYYYGMYIGSGATMNVYNNFISDLKAPASTSTSALHGVYIGGGTNVNLFYNTIYLNATSTSATTFTTNGIYASTTPTVQLRNNIVINKCTAPGSTTYVAAAYRRSSTTLTTYAATSNNNDFYAGTPSANNVIYTDGTNFDQTLAAYKVRVAPLDAVSVTENPPFVNVASVPYDLHILPVATQCESGGSVVSTPLSITDDYDGNARYPNAGYPNNVSFPAFAPDLGADEFAGIPLDATPPTITYSPLVNTTLTGARTLTATITDASGVPTSGIGLPVLYWKINSGSYTPVTATWVSGSTYTFTFGAGVVTGDVVSYYVVAQDQATPPVVGSFPSTGASGFTANPPAAGTPPTPPSSYTIVLTGLSGNYTVGLALFNNLTGKNISFERSVTRVMKEVDVEVPSKNGETADATETSVRPNSVKKLMEVEEVSWIPMENGKPYTGELFVSNVQIPGSDTTETMAGVYATVTAAITDLNMRGVIGPVTFLLTDATYPTETFPLIVSVFNDSKPTATNTVTIKPSTGVITTITGASAASQIFKIRESHFIIDGSNSGGTDRSMTIENTSTTTPQVMLVGSTGTTPITNVTIKNCNLINGVNSSSAVVISDGATSGAAGYFTNITLSNNTVQKAYIGVYCIAVVAAGNGNGLLLTQNDLSISGTNSIRLTALYVQGVDGGTVSNNTIGNIVNTTDASNVGAIWFATGTVNSSILNNTISVMSGSSTGPRGIAVSSALASSNLTISGNTILTLSTASSVPPYGIYIFSTTGNVSITRNKISGLLNTNTGGYGARAINLITTLVSSNIQVANNVISDVVCTGDASTTYWGVGIAIDGTMGGVNVYHNSVNLAGSYAGYSSATVTAAFFNSSTSTSLDVRDNIFVNSFDNTNMTTDKAYAINSQAANTAFTNINYNDYFVSGTSGILGYLTSDRTTLAAWQTATGQDASSKNVDPIFVSATDLHPSSTDLDNQGIYLAAVPLDYTGINRTNPPDIGAYEFGTNPAVITSAANGINCGGATLNGTINANGLTVNSFFDYGPTTAYGTSVAGTPATITGTTPTAISTAISMPPSTTLHFRTRGVTSGGLIVYGNDLTVTSSAPGAPAATTQAATTITDNSATLNGTVNASCNSTTVTFEYGLTTSYGFTVTALESPVSGSTAVAVSANITGLALNTLYHFRVVASNPGGTAYGSDLTLTTGANPPNVTTDAATNIGNFTARLNGTVVASNQNSTVTFQYGLNISYGTTVPGVPGTVTGNTPTAVYADISGLTYNTTYHFRCVAVNPAGTTYGGDQSFTTLCPIPEAAGTITGPTSVCQATTGNVYTVPAINYAYNGYVWTVPTGGTITAGAGTNSITVSYSSSAASGDVTVYGTSICGNGTPSSLAVTINPLPVPVINGPALACISSTYTYSTADGMSGYVWTVSAGGQIMSGGGTHSVHIKWNNTGAQYVTVTYISEFGCPAAAPTTLNVTVGNLPTPTIAGSNRMCVNSGLYVYTTETGFTNYDWSVSNGGQIVTGQGTYQIEVNWTNPGSKTVSVNYENSYGCDAAEPATFQVTVMRHPGPTGPIDGTDELCAGTQYVNYSISPIPNTDSYIWTLPSGATIVEGEFTNSIFVDFALDAVSGDISVYGVNLCGDGQPSFPYEVTVNPIPEAPVVTVDESYLLTSSAPDGNQWYFNGNLIDGATGQTYQATEEGNYYTIVTLNGCVSDMSNEVEVIFVGLGELKGSSFSIYPIPNAGNFTVSIVIPGEETFSINVYNNLGVQVYEKKDIRVNGKAQQIIDLVNPSKGIYTVVFQGDNHSVIRKVVVN